MVSNFEILVGRMVLEHVDEEARHPPAFLHHHLYLLVGGDNSSLVGFGARCKDLVLDREYFYEMSLAA